MSISDIEKRLEQQVGRLTDQNDQYAASLPRVGWSSVGFWNANPLIEHSNQSVTLAPTGVEYAPNSLPYQVDSTANPDPEVLFNSGVLRKVNYATDEYVNEQAGYPWIQGQTSVKDRIYNYQPANGPVIKVYDTVGGNVLGESPSFEVFTPYSGYVDASMFISQDDEAIGFNIAIQEAIKKNLPVYHFGDLNTKSPINLYGTKGLTVYIDGEVINTGPNSNSNAIFDLGSFGRSAQDSATYYLCNDVVTGNSGLTLTDPSDSVNFSSGDLVFVRWGDFFTVGGEDIYENAIVCEIKSITPATGVVTLSSIVKESGSNVQITNINNIATSRANVYCKKATSPTRAKLWKEGGGCYSSKFYVGEYDGDSWALCNAVFETTLESDIIRYDRILYELGVNSSDNILKYRYAEMMTAGVAQKRVIRTGEQQKRNKLVGEVLAMDRYTATDVPVYIEGSNNDIKPGVVYAKNAPQFFGQFVSQSFSPSQPKTEGNNFSAKVYAGSGTRYWNFTQSNTVDNKLSNCEFYGNVSSSAISLDGDGSILDDVYCEKGRVDTQASLTNEKVSELECESSNNDLKLRARTSKRYSKNRIGKFYQATDRDLWKNNVTVTSTDPSNEEFVTSFNAGELSIYDTLSFEIGGEVVGSSGVKQMQIVAGGQVVMNLPYQSAESGDFNVTGKIQFSSLTAIAWRFDVNSDSTAPSAQSGGAVVPDISTTSFTVSLKGYKANIGDTLRMRIYRQVLDVAGY